MRTAQRMCSWKISSCARYPVVERKTLEKSPGQATTYSRFPAKIVSYLTCHEVVKILSGSFREGRSSHRTSPDAVCDGVRTLLLGVSRPEIGSKTRGLISRHCSLRQGRARRETCRQFKLGKTGTEQTTAGLQPMGTFVTACPWLGGNSFPWPVPS